MTRPDRGGDLWESLRRIGPDSAAARSSADRFVSRPVLFERLSAAAPGTVTLVCAPAGSGKTLVVRSWAAEREEAVAWVTVDRGERDAQRFWLHVIDALADAAGDEVVQPVSPAPRFAGAVVVERLLLQLDELKEPLELVIDDLHELDCEEALAWLEMLPTRLPVELRVCSRRARSRRSACTA